MGIVVASGTSAYVSASPVETGNTVDDDGTLYVLQGGVISNTNDFGTVIVSSGGSDFGDTVGYTSDGAAQLYVLGAVTSSLISGGNEVIGFNYLTYDTGSATAIATTIDGGRQTVYSSSTASNTTISGGRQTLFGGTAIDTIIDGDDESGQEIYGGSATRTTIENGGFQWVSTEYDGNFVASAVVTSTTVESGSEQIVGFYGAGTAISTTVKDGTQIVGEGAFGSYGNGYASNTTIASGGSQDIGVYYYNVGTATSTTVTGSGR